MSLVPRRMNAPVASLSQELNRFFEDFFGSRGGDMMGSPSVWPTVNVSEDDKNVLVHAEIPGVDKKDLQVTVNRDVLTISGEKREEKKEEKKHYHRMECSYGSFMRQIHLPVDVDADHTEARVQDGVLMLRMPKAKSMSQKQISIK